MVVIGGFAAVIVGLDLRWVAKLDDRGGSL